MAVGNAADQEQFTCMNAEERIKSIDTELDDGKDAAQNS
jgi:hypothetical protein